MSGILIVGGVTLDTLQISGNMYKAIGGAGLYTALAADFGNGSVTLLCPKPNQMPRQIEDFDKRINWVGEGGGQDVLGELKIAHYGDGKAELLGAHWGKLPGVNLDALREEIDVFDLIHICPLGSVKKQIEIAHAWKSNGGGKISIGTYGKAAYGEKTDLLKLIGIADYVFMNENEARGVFGGKVSPDSAHRQLIFVTQGKKGVTVYQGSDLEYFGVEEAIEIDPTGAGDTFCGTVLANLVSGNGYKVAVRRGVKMASNIIQWIGPGYYFQN